MSNSGDVLLRAIVKCSHVLASASEIPEAFAAAVAVLRTVLPIRRAGLVASLEPVLHFYRDDGTVDPNPPDIATRVELQALLERGELLHGTIPWPAGAVGATGLLLPVLHGRDALGLLGVIPETPLQPGSREIDALRVWAHMLGGVVARSQRAREQREREALHKFSLRLSSELDLRRVFRDAIGELQNELGFDEAGLMVLDETRRVLRLFSSTAPVAESFSVIPLEGTASGEASASGHNVIVDDTSSGEFRLDGALLAQGVRSHVAQPLLKSGRVVGSLNLVSRSRGGFSSINRDLLAAVGSNLALAVDNSLLFEKVRESEDRYASLVENASELIYRIDSRGRIIFANHATGLLLNRPAEELEQSPALALLAPGQRRKSDLAALILGARAELRVDLRLKTSDGRVIPTRHRIHAVTAADGERVGYQGIALDMTGEHEAARVTQLHRDLVDAVDDYLFMAESGGRLLAMNRKARVELGWRREDIGRMTIFDLHPAEENTIVSATRDQLLETGVAVVELHLRTRSGGLIPTRARITYSPKTETLQGVFRDIREERLVQERLLNIERFSALGEIASSVAHTFSNLLAIIGTTAQVAKRLTDKEDVTRELDAIQQAVNDGGGAVRHIQNLAHRSQTQSTEDLDLCALLRDVVSIANRRSRRPAGSAIDIVYEVEQLPLIRGNEAELKDVFLNLILNAMEAMPDGGVVQLKAAHETGRLTVSVIDEGEGMSPDVRKRIFTPFFTTKGQQGAGLGLAIALNVISSHGGSIQVKSRQGRGTRVNVTLPLVETDALPTVSNRRILVASPEPLMRMQLERRLENRGHSIVTVETGAEAMASLKQDRFDCLFADLAIAAPSAFVVAEEASHKGVRAVLLAGWRDEVSEQSVRTHRVDAVLRKPFPTSALINQLQLCHVDAK